ncbi:MAG TPA: ABC transporter permease [Hanamia sp.]
MAMFKVYIGSAFRNLMRNRNYSIVNILGLGVAIASCLLIGLFIYNEISFDNNIPDKNNKYRLNEYVHYDGTAPLVSAAIGPPIASFLKDTHSEIRNYTRVFPATPDIYPSITLEYNGKKFNISKIACTDTSFDDMFGIKIIEGEKQNFLRNKNSIVLTQSLANKIFGKTSAVNKMIALHSTDSTITFFAVSNVIADMPKTSHLQVDALLPVPEYIGNNLENNYGVLLGPTYLQLQPGVNISDLQSKLTKTIHDKNKFIDMRLQPLMDVHSKSSDIMYDFYNYNKIDGKYLNIFLIIALAIFLIACMNFINLSTAVAAYRGKEIAMKKIAGANRFQIVLQVMMEAFITVLISILLSILLASIFLPYLNNILNRDLDVSLLYQPKVVGFYLIILLVTTFLAGLYPAWLISSVKINEVLKNKVLVGRSGSLLRNVLVTGQFGIAIVFIISLIVIVKQMKFLHNKDLGFNYNQVIKLPLDAESAAKLPVLHSELVKIKGVEDVTYGYLNLGGSGGLMGIDYEAPTGQQQHISVNFENAGAEYVRFFGMKLIDGHVFKKDNNGNEYLINQTLANQIGYTNPVGKEINLSGGWPQGVIVGVVKDFNYSSLHSKVEPLIIGNINFPFFQTQLYVKVSSADLSETLQQVVTTMKSISGNSEISYDFLDDTFKELYNSERQAETLVAIIGVLAIIIACLGLLGITTFMTIRRTKEIGIRKILGASAGKIAVMLSKDFLRLIFISLALR